MHKKRLLNARGFHLQHREDSHNSIEERTDDSGYHAGDVSFRAAASGNEGI